MKYLMRGLVLLGLIELLFVGTADAIDAPSSHGCVGCRLVGAIRDLAITAPQQTAVANILRADHEIMRIEIDTLVEAHKQLNSAIALDEFDEKVVRDAAMVVAAAESEFAVTRARMVSRVRALLTPEQKIKVDQLRGELQEYFDQCLAELLSALDAWTEAHRE